MVLHMIICKLPPQLHWQSVHRCQYIQIRYQSRYIIELPGITRHTYQECKTNCNNTFYFSCRKLIKRFKRIKRISELNFGSWPNIPWVTIQYYTWNQIESVPFYVNISLYILFDYLLMYALFAGRYQLKNVNIPQSYTTYKFKEIIFQSYMLIHIIITIKNIKYYVDVQKNQIF